MKYRLMTENDLEYVVEKNNEYYIFAAFSRRNTYLRFRSLLQEFSIVST